MNATSPGGSRLNAKRCDLMDLDAITDRYEITEVLIRYAQAIDSKDWALWKSTFTADAHIDLTSGGGIAGDRDAIANWLEDYLSLVPKTQHFISNIDIDLSGDEAQVTALFFNPASVSGARHLAFRSGTYRHEFTRTDDGWKSRRFVEEVEFSLR
jgi:hypothetical protein